MNILEQYQQLAAASRWHDALPVIREITERSPQIDTSWFNLGVCLDEIGRHSEAAAAFIKAQELNVEDWGTHYRIMRSLFLAEDFDQLHEFADYSCGMNDRVIHLMSENEVFAPLFARPEFQQLQAKYAQGSGPAVASA
ncbi:MAG: tetratricopeptide repeat protein [Prosthecobacter sp.]|nr:tetratricopeptide repeat protein [Prosthecobacter sp.]